jgi:hypothetical protein
MEIMYIFSSNTVSLPSLIGAEAITDDDDDDDDDDLDDDADVSYLTPAITVSFQNF